MWSFRAGNSGPSYHGRSTVGSDDRKAGEGIKGATSRKPAVSVKKESSEGSQRILPYQSARVVSISIISVLNDETALVFHGPDHLKRRVGLRLSALFAEWTAEIK